MIRILFACIENSARSIMAEAFAQRWGGERVEVRSGGSRPLGRVLPEVVEVMREKGIDVSRFPSRGFDIEWVEKECDLVVTLGCGEEACPSFAGKPLERWNLPDPKGKSLEEVRAIRDEIEERVKDLLRRWGVLEKKVSAPQK